MEPWLHPLFDAGGMREIDRWAIEDRGIPSLELMETAGGAVASAVTELSPQGPVRVICGKGNNGGDGLVDPIFERRAPRPHTPCAARTLR